MRTALIVAPDFPPSSLPCSIRPRLFASHLAEFGWRPVVIATRPEFYDFDIDPDNEALLPEGIEIIRTRALPARWMRRFGIGDIGIRSLWHSWREIRKLCRARKVDLIFISVPRNAPMVLGRLAHLRFGVPYVVDYPDPWITEVYWRMPAAQRPPKWPLAYAMARVLEPFAMRRVSHVTGVSEGTVRMVMENYPELSAVGTTALPFGAEPRDFEFLRAYPRLNTCFDPADGLAHLVYAGVYTAAMEPAMRCLFGGLRILRERNPALAARLRLHFVGTSYAAGRAAKRVEPIAEEFGVIDLVRETTARVPYLDSLQLLLDAAGLIIIGTDEPHYTASKIYPYALAAKPILAIFHEQSSAVSSLAALTPARILTFAEGRSAESQAALAADDLEALIAVDRAPVPQPAEEHTARGMTAKLAGIFDQIADGRA
ncbi:MAG TPA: glycosyltransferase [Bryobacteraceae bacterium]